jgi:DNA-binding NarL/FixJ family response regulator
MTRVLIVDDQPAFRRQLRALLTAAGLEVIGEAANIAAAEDLARSLKPDLAIMDIVLPGLSGIVATTYLKAFVPGLKVILVSAYHGDVLKASAQAVGADDFIPKDELDLDVALTWKETFVGVDSALARTRDASLLATHRQHECCSTARMTSQGYPHDPRFDR